MATLTNQPGDIIFMDNCESKPSAQWGQPLSQGWNMFTGSSQNTNNTEDLCSVKCVKEGEEGAPKPRSGSACYRIRVTKHPTKTNLGGDELQHLRAEMYFLGGGQPKTGWKWAAQSIYIPKGFCFGPERMGLSFDLKRISAGGSPCFRLEIKNGRYNGEFNNYQGHAESKDFGPVIVDKWEDWAMYNNFKHDSSGVFRFYRNKQLVWEIKGVPTYDYEGGDVTRDPYMLMGFYKWVWASPNGQDEGAPQCNGEHKMYCDEFRFGGPNATIDSMSPSGSVVVPPVVVDPPPVVIPPPATTGSLPVFDPPTPDVSTDKTTVDLKVKAKHTTANGHIKTFSIQQVSGPNTAKVTQSGQSGWIPTETNFKFENLIDGPYEFKVTTTDEIGGQATDNFKIIKKSAVPVDTTNYYVSSVESTETVNGVSKKSIVISWKDGSKTELYKKP